MGANSAGEVSLARPLTRPASAAGPIGSSPGTLGFLVFGRGFNRIFRCFRLISSSSGAFVDSLWLRNLRMTEAEAVVVGVRVRPFAERAARTQNLGKPWGPVAVDVAVVLSFLSAPRSFRTMPRCASA